MNNELKDFAEKLKNSKVTITNSGWRRKEAREMGQMIVVEENEYLTFKAHSSILIELIKEINEYANELYPNVPYWCDTGTNADVAFIQVDNMRNEIIRRRKKLFRKRR